MKRLRRTRAWALALWACWAACSAIAMDQAWVSWVMDGDTVLLLPEGGHEPGAVREDDVRAGGAPGEAEGGLCGHAFLESR